jgi:hypothetical protein
VCSSGQSGRDQSIETMRRASGTGVHRWRRTRLGQLGQVAWEDEPVGASVVGFIVSEWGGRDVVVAAANDTV